MWGGFFVDVELISAKSPTTTFVKMNIPSKLLENAVAQMASLPGVGRKTALRLVLNLLKRDSDEVARFSEAFMELKSKIRHCTECYNVSDSDICSICSSTSRNRGLICVVEDIRDVMAIEATGQYNGLYHVLGGVISPMEGVGPSDLEIESLVKRVESGSADEVIFALSSTLEGDTTGFFLHKKLSPFGVSVSMIARGIAVGDELQYADEITLGRSIKHRTPYERTLPMHK